MVTQQDGLRVEVTTRDGEAPGRPIRAWPEAAVLLVAAAVFGWRSMTPSPWWDEAVTRHVVSRPYGEITRLVTQVDLVHYVHYLLGHTVFRLAGSPEGSGSVYGLLRLGSVVAAALTAVGLVRLGRATGSVRVGVLAAAAFIASPVASRYAQEGRAYALAALAAVAATVVLARHLFQGGGRAVWPRYGLGVLATALLSEIALLVLLPHLVLVLMRGDRAQRRAWALTAGVVVALLVPFAVASARQSGQIAWLSPPGPAELTGLWQAQWGLAALSVPAALVPLVLARRRREDSSTAVLAATWGLATVLLLWLVSQVEPLFLSRYLFFTLPGLCLGLGLLAARLPRTGAVVLVVLAVVGVPRQLEVRNPTVGHSEGLRSIAGRIATDARPDDAVLYLPAQRRVVQRGFPDALTGVADLALGPGRDAAADLYGAEPLTPAELGARAAAHPRIWLVNGEQRMGERLTPVDREKLAAVRCLTRTGYWPVGEFSLELYDRAVPAERGQPRRSCPPPPAP